MDIIPENTTLVFFVNGKKVVDDKVDPEWTLLYYLRTKLRLSGTKLGCAEGGCGACTVMVSRFDRKEKKICHIPVNACLAPVCSMHGLAITTVEGIGSTKTRLHPVQERIAKAHGSQCGFCTPGIVMSMYTLLRSMDKPAMKDLEVAFQGNLCRCTGYRPIIEGYKSFTEDWELMQATNGLKVNGNGLEKKGNVNGCGMGDKCCKLQQKDEEEVLFKPSEFLPYDKSQEPIFPPELKVSDVLDTQQLCFKGPSVTWYRPTSLKDLLALKTNFPEAKIIVGNTEVGVEVKFKHSVYPVLITPTQVPELTNIEVLQAGIKVGASVTLMEMEVALREQIKQLPENKTRVFRAIVNMLHWFAGKQIRSVAAVGGNIMTGSPISDLNPVFMAAKIELHLQDSNSSRIVLMDEHFFTGYRRNVVKPTEILTAITIPFTKPSQYFVAYKQARRRDDDIAIVNAAVNVLLKEGSNIVEDVDLAFGGMAPTTTLALKTKNNLRGLPWNKETLEIAYSYLLEDLPLAPSAPGGMIQYRRSLTLSFLFRAYLEISQQLQKILPNIELDNKDTSGIDGFHYKVPKSSQYFQVLPETNEKNDQVGRPVTHTSAFKQATGEAVYCDDMPVFENELYMAVVLSTKPHAKILNINAEEALKMDGIHGFLSAKDLRPVKIGPVAHDEEVFVSETVTSQGQLLGVVLGDSQIIAQRAARKVKVDYEELTPVIITIEDAIKYESYFPNATRVMQNGDVDRVFKEAECVVEGECRTGYQEHFYFETNCVIVVPKKEDYELEIYSSTQHPSEVSAMVSEVLEIPQNRIITKVKRLGGGFGGKESRAFMLAVPAALAASRYNRPVRIMLDRDEDMMMTGGRHPFLMRYKTAFDRTGKIIGCEISMYNNAGFSLDLSMAVMERAMFHFENSYNIQHVRMCGYVCKTNLSSNTAFRGFGGPQGMFLAETMVRHVADYLKKDIVDVCRLNLYKEGDITFYKQELTYCTLQRCWDECLESSEYYKRIGEIEKYNKENRWKKRGLSVIPTKYGIAFTIPFLNQAGALVLVYRDGSVLLTHGGTEMGQGLHTKMIQVASKVLEIPISKIHISETATDKVPNTSPTAASAGSDLNGMAVMNACKKIKDRLEPIRAQNPKGNWDDWISQAYFDRISLSATGFYKTPDVGYNWDTNTGMAFNYFTYGVACSEVEIDCLTGDHQVLRTDIVMDLGESLNPAIDIGQVEGAFMQGYGLFVMEEMMYSPTGTVYSRGPGMYKLPGFGDIPVEFNVSLLKGAPNPRAVYSSKAVGEPPLFLASSVLFAIKEAIKSARSEIGLNDHFILDSPATSAKIRMACQDNLTKMLDEPEKGKFTPWNVTA